MFRWTFCIALLYLPTWVFAEDNPTSARPAIWLEGLVVTPAQSGSAVAIQSGRLQELLVGEGDVVAKGDLIAKLDDAVASIQLRSAKQELAILQFKQRQTLAMDAAQASLDSQRLAAKKHAAEQSIHQRIAENKNRVLAAEKAEAVAKNEWSRAINAKEEFADAVSQSEIDQLKLAYEQRMLETKQAVFDQEVHRLQQSVDAIEKETLDNEVYAAEVALKQAEADQTVAKLQLDLQAERTELAQTQVEQLHLQSPLPGVVVDLTHRVGDWIPSGEAVARIVHLDRLRVEGFLPAKWISTLQQSTTPTLMLELPSGETLTRKGESLFISPEVDPLTKETRFWVEFDNSNGEVLPGASAKLQLPTGKGDSSP
ncbi:efflux RND transporter periplasmic adaptor subunit [Rhodopirellula halodulae]|uniref:efflux RND transporter periplasmic adaptor subunit n=1 Tax=Rhodopirellula halodulae TaxID=2894198 RepID=UPI001E3D2A7F|nr:HlyD family efflux transporter periplasmic adaptor subunit [Rhodopirellula sp. JC737]MCC9656862.1 HlyD family efflux transporter periplasmic adaptor subunit [Rhodopirellula sp. JC737]